MDKQPTIDTRNYDRTFKELMGYTKRTIAESRLRAGYFFSRAAVKLTKGVPPSTIESQLVSPSRVSPTMNVSELIANKIRQAKGLPWLHNKKLATEGRKVVKRGKSSANVVRAQWLIPAKALSPYVTSKSGAAYTPGSEVKTRGLPKGGASFPTTEGWNTKVSVWNSYQGSIKKWQTAARRNISAVQRVIIEGAQAALDFITAQDREYLRKRLREGFDKFNRK